MNVPRRTGKKEVEVKKEGRLIKTTITRNIYCKSCAALHKENWGLYANFQSKTESKMVTLAQMKPLITNLTLNNLIT